MDDAEGGSLDLAEVEAELCRLPDVAAVRIVADSVGRPVEVHVLAHTGKQPKQVVRDVQSVALASFGIELDRRIVSVVQLGPNGASTAEAPSENHMTRAAHHRNPVTELGAAHDRAGLPRAPRRRSRRVRRRFGCRFRRARVWSRWRRSTRSVSSNPAPTVSTSTARRSSRAGSHDVVVVSLVYVDPPLEHHLTGSAMLHHNADDATVRAVLDATNRRLRASRDTARRRVTTPSGRRPDPTRR